MRSLLVAFVLLVLSAVLAADGLSSSARSLRSASLYISPTGSDSANCRHTSPCRSFARAYKKARPGQVVQVAGGSYGPQSIPVDGSKQSKKDVVFRPAPGSAVSVSSLDVYGSHVKLERMRLTSFPYLRTWRQAADLTFHRLRAARFTIMGSHNVRLRGGNYGPSANAYSSIQSEGANDTKVATNVRLVGVTIHDYRQTDGSSHVDCLHIFGARGVVIRRSLFYNCEAFAILFTKIPGSPVPTPTNVTIENNFIDCCGSGYFSIYLGDQHGERWSNFLVRNNSTNKPIGIGYDNTTVSRLRFLSNIAPSFQGCHRAGVSAHYNIWYHGSRCGRHDRVSASGFHAPGRHDFHIVRGAPAIGRGDPGSHLDKDYDGERRPMGRLPDAGADERG